MKIPRLSTTGLLVLVISALPDSALAQSQSAQPSPSDPPSAPPPPTPATSEPAVVPAAAAPTAPPDGIATPDKPSLAPPAGKIDLTTPPPGPSTPRSYHMHDGFYARASIGIGSLSATVDDDSPSRDSLKGSGGSLHLNLLIGGSPSPGLAIGGALLAEGTASVDFDRNDVHVVDRSMSLAILGPFIDGFPRPSRGWHFGGTLGLARLSLGSTSLDKRRDTNGIGGAFWLGNDFWVAEDWSVGPLLKFTGALTKASDPDISAGSFSISILFTALYH
jgi:hypothetical protein